MSSTDNTVAHARDYVTRYLQEKLSPQLSFHNLNHTQEVVLAVQEIAADAGVSGEELAVIQVAAWFHDTGYCKVYTGHEDISKEIAGSFLESQHYPQSLTDRVLACIEATRYPQNPLSPEAMIICDADLCHLTRPNYHHYEEALRKELQTFLNKNYTAGEWNRVNCDLLIEHKYFTDYGKNVLQKFKEVNIDLMKCRLQS